MSNQCKYYKQKKQYRYIGETNWNDVVPAEYRKGELYEAESIDCSCSARTVVSGTLCYNLSTYERVLNQLSCTTDSDWVTTAVTRGNLIEELSVECGGDANASYPFTVRNLSNDNCTVLIDARTTNITLYFKYSTDDGATYRTVTGRNSFYAEVQLPPNGTVKVISNILSYPSQSLNFSTNNKWFGMEGNVLSLSMGDNYNDDNEHTIEELLGLGARSTWLKDASKLSFGKHVKLGQDNYKRMFSGATNLVSAPKILPATEVPAGAYKEMFFGCSKLVNGVQYIMGESFSGDCMQRMFSGCTAMTSAPVIVADELVDLKLECMFANCKSMESPDKPYNIRYTYSNAQLMESMFSNCSGLTTSPIDTLEINFTCDDELCYQMCTDMFVDCNNLLETPKMILKGNFKHNNFNSAFKNCVSLMEATILTPEYTGTATICQLSPLKDGSSTVCNMFENVYTSNGVFYKSEGTTWSGIPPYWSQSNYSS